MRCFSVIAATAIVLMPVSGATSNSHGGARPWDNPSYRKDIPATQAISRPEPGRTGWPLWMKHHEDRKRWVAERKVDLLMIGDSITFRWSRDGKKVWDEYYAKRNGCNIGSSGDWTKHMLWHFQHGGLDGMKGRNPKLVVLMIGTNNRGKPEEVAYGILAILKELRARLPESKILLLGIFPRGWEPTSALRVRNNQVNEIIRTYADDKVVHWLDIGHIFLHEDGELNRGLMPDGVHVMERGFRAWAEAMEPTIKRLMDAPYAAGFPPPAPNPRARTGIELTRDSQGLLFRSDKSHRESAANVLNYLDKTYLARVRKHYPDQDASAIKLAPRPTTDGLNIHEDLVYARWGDRAMVLDLYLPKDHEKAMPLVLFIHGGGWVRGSHRDYRPAAMAFAKRGFAAATVEYRLAGEAMFPAAIYDVKAAIRWLRANAKQYQLDPKRFGITGGSAGGNIAVLTAVTFGDSRFKGPHGFILFSPHQALALDHLERFFGKHLGQMEE